jgi:tetratricopeptide (TPR) repeat protein
MGRGGIFGIFLWLVAVIWPLATHAESPETLQQAKTHFEAGRALYQLGRYDDAVREFTAGHQLVPRPQFLLNLGQCYRKLDDLEAARDMYRRFLAEVAVDDPQRPEAEEVLQVIERGLANGEGHPHRVEPIASPGTEGGSAALLAVHHDAPRKSFLRRNWWIIPTSAVVVGVAVGLGVYYGTRPSCSNDSLGCFTLEPWN